MEIKEDKALCVPV